MDDLGNMVSGAAGAADPAAVGVLGKAIEGAGGLDGLLAQLRAGGLGDAVDSWVSTGQNQPVQPQQLGAALGPETVARLSSGSGLDIGQLLPLLAGLLPQIIDALTPGGSVPSGGLNGAIAGGLPDLGGLLGGVVGGSGSPDIGGMIGGMLGSDKDR